MLRGSSSDKLEPRLIERNKVNLSETDLNCINRALKEFLKSRDKSIYDFSHYMELQDKIENHILFNKESLKNLIEVKSIKTA